MKIDILRESGFEEAVLGLSLSYDKPFDYWANKITPQEKFQHMERVAEKLANKDGGHNNFLESIVVWLDIKAPRYWWSQMDRYRVGKSQQSESTMHTILKRELTQEDFEDGVHPHILNHLNFMIEHKDIRAIKINLPEGFLQRRIVTTNYKVIRNIIQQRKVHKLNEWGIFCDHLMKYLKYKTLLEDLK